MKTLSVKVLTAWRRVSSKERIEQHKNMWSVFIHTHARMHTKKNFRTTIYKSGMGDFGLHFQVILLAESYRSYM